MKNIIYLLLLIVVFMSCEEPSDSDILNPYTEVAVDGTVELDVLNSDALWIEIEAESATFQVTGQGLSNIESVTVDVRLVTVDEGGDNIAGAPATLETISDVSSFADTISLTYSGSELLDALALNAEDVTPGSKFVVSFKKTISGQVYADRASFGILVSCPTSIPAGTYDVKGQGSQVQLTYDGAGVYTVSNLNYNYYNVAYGDIPAKFLDVCNNLTLQGFNEGTAYGIAWVGSGTYNEASGEIALTYADATYNPTAFASVVLVPVE